MRRIGLHPVVEVRAEGEYLAHSFARHGQLNGRKGRVLHLDASALGRRAQPVAAAIVPPHYRGKQLDQRHAAARRALMEPGAVTGDAECVSKQGTGWMREK